MDRVHPVRRRVRHRNSVVDIWGVESFLNIVKADPEVARKTFAVVAGSETFWQLVEQANAAQAHYHTLLNQLEKLRKKLTKNLQGRKPDGKKSKNR